MRWPACLAREPVRCAAIHVQVLTLKTDLRFWPTWELRLDPGTAEWKRIQHA
jgi:hypothetical protein